MPSSKRISRFYRPLTVRATAVGLLVLTGSGALAQAETPYANQHHYVFRAQDVTQATPTSNAYQRRVHRQTPVAKISVAPVTQAQAPKKSPRHLERPLLGIISELRGGFFDHDAGVFGRNKEDGNDYNFETLFVSPGLLDFVWSPRPMLGITFNDDNNTSQFYGGLTREWLPLDNVFVDFSLGFAVHNGNLNDNELGRKDLGSRVLFRESLELGWNFYNKDSISIILDHVSHGHLLADANEGMDSLGVRYGYRF